MLTKDCAILAGLWIGWYIGDDIGDGGMQDDWATSVADAG